MPDGRIGWCEDYVDKYVISHVDNKKFDLKVIESFKKPYDDLPECATCSLYPNCIRLSKCDIDTPWCTELKRNVQIHQVKTAMKNEYKIYQNDKKLLINN